MIYLSVVIPVYNEENRITECLQKVHEFFKNNPIGYEVIISDDGSKDNTKDIVRKFMSVWKELRILENKHRGKAPTIISGIFEAKGKYVLFTDVDLSVDISESLKLLNVAKNQGYDLAIASREGKEAKRINEPLKRHIMGRIFNYIVQALVLPGINDTQCGFKLFRTEAAQQIFKKTLLYSIYSREITGGRVSAFDVEILYVARRLGLKIKEVPVTWVYGETSKVNTIKDSYYNLKDVLKVKLNSIQGKYNY